MSVSTRRRFAIFERDQFTCQYCGEKPPEVILHVDHMVSIKDGGGDEDENLITACRQCNLGKSAKSVDVQKIKKMSFKKELAELEEKKAQLEAYYEYIKRKKEMKHDEVNIFQRCWEDCSDGRNKLTEKGLEDIRKLSQKFTTAMIFEAIDIAWNASHIEENSKFRYMCGVLRQLKLKQENPLEAERKMAWRKMFYRLKKYWENQPKGSGYFDEKWFNMYFGKFGEQRWKNMMDEAGGYWNELKEIVNKELHGK